MTSKDHLYENWQSLDIGVLSLVEYISMFDGYCLAF